MRGYQYCTVGLTFKPTTTSGTFSTDIQVTDRDTGVHSVTVDGDVKTCCPRKHKRRKACASDTNETVNYLANLNLVSPVPSTHVYVDDKTLVFDEYYEANEGLAVIALDAPVDFLSRLTFDVNQTTGLFMLKLLGDNGMYCIPNIKRTNRYGFMFPAGKALNKLNFITNSVAYSGVVSNLSLIEISDLNQTSTQESNANCGDDLHSFCNIDLHKVCDRDHKRDSHKTCDRDHKRDSHKTCDRDHKRDSHKTCDRDHKRDSHKTCDRDHKRDSHKTCDRDDKRDSHKTCDRDDKRDSHKTCDRDDKRDSHKTCDRDHKRDSHKTCDRNDKRDSHKTCDRDHKRDSHKTCDRR